ncbi:serine/threonine protein kinase [Streptomyces sp. NBC_01239]|uniref:serine/threonine protein kinase n=1 Tax=Streptomyces sp. NBC_01239 TaxID=2903792 RepID=UPI00225C3B8B|nr:serine/threonine-protein kinase [Streptomyces sp. NBC_01239]MCX4810674.1 serine/threonine protein kinase [Streptomyces sp. NBC_01239]
MSNRIEPVQPGDPRRVGPYRVVGRLGSGGMGTVYAALTATGERVAVKVVHPAQAADDEFRARFRREVQLSQRITGQCLVPVRDADTQAATPWLVTPYIPGLTLDRHVTANGPLSGGRLYALAAGTAAALAAVHAQGVVHRDVKPQNVILAPSGPQVLDFGIAHALDGTSVTRTGMMTGTPGWISPEHYRTGAVGSPGDVFAWGALIAYAATGQLPFGGGAADAVAFRVMQAEPDLDDVPTRLRRLVEQALSKEPSERPSAAELAGECTELLAAQATAVLTSGDQQPTLISDLVSAHWDLTPEVEPAWPTPPGRNSRTRLYLAVAVAAAVLGSLGGALAAASQSSNSARGQAPAPSSETSAATATAAAQRSTPPTTSPAATSASAPATSQTPQQPASVPSPAYTRSDNAQPNVDEWAAARLPATSAEKTAAEHLITDAAPVLQGKQYMGDTVTVTFNPTAQTMFVTFGPGIYPEGQDYRDDTGFTDIVRGLMFGSCSEAQQNFGNDAAWPYGRAVLVYRESMASPTIVDYREVTHIDSCRV